MQIAWDYGNGNLQTAYEYEYDGDGVKVLERRYRTAQHWTEYRFIGCGAGCAGSSLSVYARGHINGQNTAWRRAEELVGWMTSGFCRGLMLPLPPKPCPTPRVSPCPRLLPGGGLVWALCPLSKRGGAYGTL